MVYFSLPTNHQTTIPTATASTNKVILDHLLYLSIRSRIKKQQRHQQRQPSSHRSSPCHSRRERQNKAVESMVTGILSSHRNNSKHHQELDPHFGQRLHLCQLAALVFGRYDTTAGIYDIPSSPTNQHRHSLSLLTHCRMHHQENCMHDCPTTTTTTTNLARHSSTTLIQAIPVFLKVTAGLLRQTLDKQQKDKTPMMVDGEKVMGGGLPRTWYALFLDLMTQAVIEAYLCDGQVGMESIVSVFSYGYMDDENDDDPEEEDHDDQDSEDDDDNDDSLCAADHHLLFPKTRSMFIFKTQILEREQEFLNRRAGSSLQEHFQQLAAKYPVELFDQSIRNFIQMILDTMDIPALEKDGRYNTTTNSCYSPSFELADGTLFMPEIQDDDPLPSSSSLVFPKHA
ncbi:hypothetical protein [Absidia glauca]|uniref:Uncharacterized protein n=1 Tax=Absidia glauca TaxID=4829 RepID=A0A163K3K7_ABSGL|nr:hypothetical protein [Absidia glauca]